ncbi:flippase, partial [bacterium]|nr:flippase [bacterium]
MSISNEPYWFRFTPLFVRQRLNGRVTLHAIINNTGWLLGDRALRLGLSLFVGAWVARYLGPSKYGEFSYVIAYVAFFQTISELGLNGVVIRDMARDRQASAAILGTVFRLRIVTGFICWIAAIASMAIIQPGDQNTLALTAIISGGLVFQTADIVDLWFQSQTQSRRTVGAKIISYLINSVFKIFLVLASAPLIYFAIAVLFEIVLSSIALYFSYRRFSTPFAWVWDMKIGKQLLGEAWPYLLSYLAITIYTRTDQIMLREMHGTNQLGIFSAAIPISNSWQFIPLIIFQSASPSIANKKQYDPNGYDRSIEKLFALMWWIMLPISVSISIFSGPIVSVLYGEKYMASASVLGVLVFTNIPVALGVMQNIWILNERMNKITLTKTVFGAVANVGLNFVMIPKYGALGAAFSSVVAQCISAVFFTIILAPKIFRRQMCSWLI